MEPVVAPGVGVAFVQGADVAEFVCAGFVPAHAAAFEAFTDHILAGRFDRARADLPAVFEVARVVGTVQVIAEEVRQFAMFFRHGECGAAEVEGFEFGQHGGTAGVFEFVTPSVHLAGAVGGRGEEDFGEFLKMFDDMPKVEDEVILLDAQRDQDTRQEFFEAVAAVGEDDDLIREVHAQGEAESFELFLQL